MKRFLLLALLLPIRLFAQVSDTSALFKTLQVEDSLLFSTFNTCNTAPLETILSRDFKFYHDKGGITPDKAAFKTSIENNICKLPYKAERRLVRGSLTVFPLYNNGVLYGAIQMGVHKFYAIDKAGKRPTIATGIARFTHVWQLEDGVWRIVLGLSYDHQPLNE